YGRDDSAGHVAPAGHVASAPTVSGYGTLHLMGLLSDGGVHSHIDHLMVLLEIARIQKVRSLVVHPFLDGRDTHPMRSIVYLTKLINALENRPDGTNWRIGTVMGRYYAMDRDSRWDRIKKAYDAIVLGEGVRDTSVVDAVERSFSEGKTDEFVLPIVICENDCPVGKIEKGDRVIFFNFRADRARQLTRAITQPVFDSFGDGVINRAPKIFVTLTEYDRALGLPSIFPPVNLTHLLGEVLSQRGLLQCRIAETEKYAHVTYFFNGGREAPFEGEERILIPSPRDVATYDQNPAMSAHAVAEAVVRQIKSGRFDFILINFANPDMVGHSGNLEAAMEAVRIIDGCLEKVVGEILLTGGLSLITADHGNLEQMMDYETGAPHTAHTTLPVPLIMVAADEKIRALSLRSGIHANIAPTILELLGIPIPPEMNQASLLSG
ncbi:MAG: 2,3-bisphosphoglycerate-independent phosphoglycerate mutase, partial [Nitrospirae bacterium]|nr:2,3-bisphosphoglycerate-independent phosphoglycerate mutase [Candidatus Troglogloeales bacterium]